MSLNIDMKIIRPWNCSGSPHVIHELLDFLDELQSCDSWEIFHSNSSILRQLCPKFCIVMNLWTNPTAVPMQYLMLGSDSPLQDITQNLRNTWTFACERLMTSSSFTRDNSFHVEFSKLIWDTPKISSDCSTINSSDISNICFKVRFFLSFFDGMQSVWVILHHEYRCFSMSKT